MKLVNSCSVQAQICELLLWKSGFDLRVVLVGCLVDLMAEGTHFSLSLQISPVNYHSTRDVYCFICCLWYGQQIHDMLQFQKN